MPCCPAVFIAFSSLSPHTLSFPSWKTQKEKLAEAEKELATAQSVLKQKQDALRAIQRRVRLSSSLFLSLSLLVVVLLPLASLPFSPSHPSYPFLPCCQSFSFLPISLLSTPLCCIVPTYLLASRPFTFVAIPALTNLWCPSCSTLMCVYFASVRVCDYAPGRRAEGVVRGVAG